MNEFLEDTTDVYEKKYKDLKLLETTIKNKTFGNVQISSSSFFSISFDNVIFNQVVFTHVDFSNSNFTNCGLHYCQFVDCKMIGTSFSESTLKFCKFHNISGRYMSICSCKIHDLSITESDLLEARFLESFPNKFVFENVNLKNAEFNMFSLKNVDLSTCNIENFLIDPKYLRGVTLNYSQMVDLAPILGILLK